MKWCDMSMVVENKYTEHAKMAAVSHGISHVTTKQHCKHTTLVDIKNYTIIKPTTQSDSQNHTQQEHNEPAWERRIELHKSNQQQFSPCATKPFVVCFDNSNAIWWHCETSGQMALGRLTPLRELWRLVLQVNEAAAWRRCDQVETPTTLAFHRHCDPLSLHQSAAQNILHNKERNA